MNNKLENIVFSIPVIIVFGILVLLINIASRPPVQKSVCIATDSAIQLTRDNYSIYVKSDSVRVVLFCAPWCDQCRQIKETLEDFGIVDIENEADLVDSLEIRAIPTLIEYYNGDEINRTEPNVKFELETKQIIQYKK